MSFVVPGSVLTLAGLTATCLLATVPSAHGQPGINDAAAVSRSGDNQPNPPRRVELTWSPTYMATDHRYTAAEAKVMAHRFDIIVGNKVSFDDYVSAMKAIKPKLAVLVYTNSTFVTPRNAGSVPEADFARDLLGRKIKSKSFGNYLMDPASADWRSRATNECRQWATSAHYDGCLVDMLTMGIFTKNYVSAMPINRDTGRQYTERQWRARLIQLAHQYAADDPQQIIVGNAVSNYYRYWRNPVSSRAIVKALPGAQMEDFMRGAYDPAVRFPTGKVWRENVRVVRDIQAVGDTGLFSTKLWSGASPAQVAAWEAYSMASFLLAADGHAYWAFTQARTKPGAMQRGLPFHMPRAALGAPLARMKHHGRTYRRQFKHGKVVVNPTTKAAKVHLRHWYTDLEGHRVRTVKLSPHSGDVFVRKH